MVTTKGVYACDSYRKGWMCSWLPSSLSLQPAAWSPTQTTQRPAHWHSPYSLQPAALSLRGVICRQLGTPPTPYSQLPCHSEG